MCALIVRGLSNFDSISGVTVKMISRNDAAVQCHIVRGTNRLEQKSFEATYMN